MLVGGLYILKKMGNDRLRIFWNRSSTQERASLLQMVLLACVQFTNARKNSTITKTKVSDIYFVLLYYLNILIQDVVLYTNCIRKNLYYIIWLLGLM